MFQSFFGMNFPFGFGSMKPIWIWVVATAVLWFVAFLILLYAIQERHKDLETQTMRVEKKGSFLPETKVNGTLPA
jgi:divalent metal cation (Fe/Co/Zn/Cd) transporter